MRRKNRSRKARRTGTPVGEEELYSDCEVTEEVYEVECIVDHRSRRGGTEYKVRWRGWSPQFDEWLHYSKMDCPEAIKEYWEQVEARKSKEPGSSKKRDHSDTHSVKSNSSRRSTSSPEAKRRLFDNTDLQGGSQDSGSVSPTISECLGRASPKQYVQAEALEDRQSVEKGDTNSKSASVEPNERINSVAQEGVEPDTQPQPALGVASTSLQAEIRSTDVSARSSPCSLVQQPERKSTPLPPPFPKRKRVQSLSGANTSSPSTAIPLSKLSDNSASGPFEDGLRKSESLSVPSEAKQDVRQDQGSRDIQENVVNKAEPISKGPFVRPHGFDRGLTVERIHGFIRRADLLFAVVQFKNCDVVEILATHILKHYEPMALIRGFEEHHIRSRRNAILSSPQLLSPPPSSKQQC
uniref:Chromo domain-containing protein n=1 Tax=Haemonchus contortus TaxID=6289 RepID=A0A7I4XZ31_HAECO